MICRVTKLEQKDVEICDKHEQMSKRLEELANVDIDSKIREALIEQRERENRKLSIMCFGLLESERETPKAMSKRLEELANVDIDSKIREALIEQRERENRKLSIMCFGLLESERETPKAMNEDDVDQIMTLAETVMGLEEPEKVLVAKSITYNSENVYLADGFS